jgi:hypothetical protein
VLIQSSCTRQTSQLFLFRWIRHMMGWCFYFLLIIIGINWTLVVTDACSDGCSCIDGIGECLSPTASRNPFFGQSLYSLTTLHLTTRQLAWFKWAACSGRLVGVQTIYLHTTAVCYNKQFCRKRLLCW